MSVRYEYAMQVREGRRVLWIETTSRRTRKAALEIIKRLNASPTRGRRTARLVRRPDKWRVVGDHSRAPVPAGVAPMPPCREVKP